ncbi:ABC transporter ATP-binding protein [Haladaptatus halobius]|uniref:ABC transporter ATP-binding protein n=1 Tax=Haladaptatus halobius TaxID=2884875 RepID=UPI001D0BDC52|nr:ABC transporter ATP-binding protein [Haladaptatus halobius]
MSTTAISIGNLSKTFDHEDVLTGIDLEIAGGEFCVVVGPSGCGKSTLLKCIAGLLDANGGQVELNGTDVGAVPVRDLNVGFVFQEFENTLFPHKTVAGNVAFGLEQRDLSTTKIEQRVDAILDLLAITETKNSPPNELSGGQQQRVELARQLVRDCETMLLDDPLADLDYKLQKRMELELRHLQRDTGSTYVYVTHNQDQALKLADKLVVMNRGRIEQVGSPLEVYDQPKTAFVGRFIGDSNLFRGELQDRDGHHVTLDTEMGSVTAVTATEAETLPSESVALVRPENIVLGDSATTMENSFEGRLEGRTYSGEITEFTVSVPAESGEQLLEIVEHGEKTVGEMGQPISLGWNSTDALYFDTISVTETMTVEDLEAI